VYVIRNEFNHHGTKETKIFPFVTPSCRRAVVVEVFLRRHAAFTEKSFFFEKKKQKTFVPARRPQPST